MKNLQLQIQNFQNHKTNFKDWLKTLNYSKSTIYNLPNQLNEFFYYLEQKNITKIRQITKTEINQYFEHLNNRKNQRNAGGLSNAHINKHIQTLRKFNEFLLNTKQIFFPIEIQNLEQNSKEIEILSKQEIRKLYKTIELEAEQTENKRYLAQRDKVILGVYYACGLRRAEGENLELEDINFSKKLLFISKSKTGRSRYIPLNTNILSDIIIYINNSRKYYLNRFNKTSNKLFISKYGNNLTSQSMLIRLKELLQKAKIKKQIGLHSLRHSIATHLLSSGMPLESISKFLGHQSLESTQIYTHLKEL